MVRITSDIMKYVVQCRCGHKTGCLPPNMQPPPPPGAPRGWRVNPEELRQSKLCCMCGRTLDDTKGQYLRDIDKPQQVDNLLSILGASNSR